MKHEKKKISKMVDEILTYFLFHYNSPAEIRVTPKSGSYLLEFTFSKVEMDKKEFEKLKNRLVSKRVPELEDYYWQLAGELDDSDELMLVAMMSDTVEMKQDAGQVKIKVTRKL